MYLRRWLPFLFPAALAMGQTPAVEVQVVPYDSAMVDRVSVDGTVDREEPEYPAHFIDKATGISVSWGHDDTMLYVALETRGTGWIGVGFGAAGTDTATAFVGFYTEDSADVYTMRLPYGDQGLGAQGTPGYAAAKPVGADSLEWEGEIDRDDETGVTTIEVACPLILPAAGARGGGLVLAPGKTYDLVLAQNSKSTSLGAKATHRSLAKFKLGAKG